MACDQVTVARKLAELAARRPIQIPARKGESGMQRVDNWMTENTKTAYGMYLCVVWPCCCCSALLSLHLQYRAFPAQSSIPSLFMRNVCQRPFLFLLQCMFL